MRAVTGCAALAVYKFPQSCCHARLDPGRGRELSIAYNIYAMSQIVRPRVNTGRLIGSTAGMADTGRTSWTGYRVHGRYRGDPVGRPADPYGGDPEKGPCGRYVDLPTPPTSSSASTIYSLVTRTLMEFISGIWKFTDVVELYVLTALKGCFYIWIFIARALSSQATPHQVLKTSHDKR